MRVLMLGWEFPPHISGGLGTACLGISQGLADAGVEVLFVVPRAFGDEDARYARVIGANAVPLPGDRAAAGTPAAESPSHGELARRIAEVPLSGEVSALLERLGERVRLLAIDSPLRPYLDEQSFAQRRQATGRASPGWDEAEPWVPDAAAAAPGGNEAEPWAAAAPGTRSPDWDEAEAWVPDAAESAAPDAASERLDFAGGYGPGLLEEVGRYARVVAELARRERFDVVHAHDWMTYPAGVVAAAVSGKPLVAHLHASEYDRSGENPNPRVRDIEQLGLSAADRVICVSHFLAATVRERYGLSQDKIRVIHNAVTLAEEARAFHVERATEEPIVLYLGRVTYQKGPDYFLRAARRVVEVEPRVKFVLSGSGDLLPGVIERAASLGLARHVHFTGFLRGRDVERMYALADLYVMPSVSEPFGISPLEAMALDVPVIVSRQSGVSEVVQSALKFDYWDVDDLANKILAVIRRPALRQQLTEEGGEEARRMRWDLRGRRLQQVYRELAS